MRKSATISIGPGEVSVALLSLVGLYALSRYSYPAFHTIVELFSIVIGFSLFMLIWNSKRIIDNRYLIFIGIAYLRMCPSSGIYPATPCSPPCRRATG